MIEPSIEDLLETVDSKYTLVTLSARRAREINSYYQQLGEGFGAYAPPQVHSTSRKPITIALEEVAAGKITFDAEAYEKAVKEIEEWEKADEG